MYIRGDISMKIKKTVKYIFIAALAALLSFLALRIFMTSDRSTLNDVYPTESAILAYENKGAAAFTTCTIPHDMSEDGYFVAYAPAYCENVGEFQITVRYNDSLPQKYLKGSDPDKYYYELRDGDGNTVSRAKVVAEKERYFYNHFRLSFEDVEITDTTELYLFLCSDDASPSPYPEDHTEGIIVTHPSISFRQLHLSSGEKKALSKQD